MARSKHPDSASAQAIRGYIQRVIDMSGEGMPPYIETFPTRKEAEHERFKIYAYIEGLRRNVKRHPAFQIDLIKVERFTIGLTNSTLIFNDQTKGPMGVYFKPIYEERLAIAQVLDNELTVKSFGEAALEKPFIPDSAPLPDAPIRPVRKTPVLDDEKYFDKYNVAPVKVDENKGTDSPVLSTTTPQLEPTPELVGRSRTSVAPNHSSSTGSR